MAQLNRHRTIAGGAVGRRPACSTSARHASTGNGTRWSAPLGIEAESTNAGRASRLAPPARGGGPASRKGGEVRQSLEPLEQAFQHTRRAAISRALTRSANHVSTSDCDLAEVLEQAEAVIKRHDDLSQKTGEAGNQARDGPGRAGDRRALASDGRGRADRLAKRVVRDDGPIGLEAEATPEQAEVFLTKISELLEKLTDRRDNSKPDSRHRPRRRLSSRATSRRWRLASPRDLCRSRCRRAGARTGPPAAGRTGRCAEMHGTLIQQRQREAGKSAVRPRSSARKHGFAWNGSARRRVAPISTNFPRPNAARRT